MKFTTQKRIAGQLLKVGTKKVWFDPEKLTEIKEAITKSDIRSLIAGKFIKIKKAPSQSRSRARKIRIQKRKGNQKGPGARRGKKTARLSKKENWMAKIRTQRKLIRELKQKNLIENLVYKNLLDKAKGGFFRNKRHIKLYLEEKNLFKKNA
ncbi:MAG: 50S ribosomal protein L19e [Nanoarchaeota archaeon]|jgi:large subunit ribosomal protein L19e|nr:50S ribosomal protein L19e [Nanoarchaeota archaeon]|tara:strand:- start:23406 stop:23861 length:456 start_codon:yes stop_codon:yes gene_type:complete